MIRFEDFDIDIRTSDGARVDVEAETPAGIEGDRSGLCRYAIGRIHLDEGGPLDVTLEADEEIPPLGAMVVSAANTKF